MTQESADDLSRSFFRSSFFLLLADFECRKPRRIDPSRSWGIDVGFVRLIRQGRRTGRRPAALRISLIFIPEPGTGRPAPRARSATVHPPDQSARFGGTRLVRWPHHCPRGADRSSFRLVLRRPHALRRRALRLDVDGLAVADRLSGSHGGRPGRAVRRPGVSDLLAAATHPRSLLRAVIHGGVDRARERSTHVRLVVDDGPQRHRDRARQDGRRRS